MREKERKRKILINRYSRVSMWIMNYQVFFFIGISGKERKLYERRYFVRFDRWRFAMVFDKISNSIRRKERR